MALKYKINDQREFYFVTFTVINWVDIFTRDCYREVFTSSIKYCQKNKGLLVGAWVIMTNHVHMINGTDGTHKLEDIIRDLKSYTSRHIRLQLEQSTTESRKNWIMFLFNRAGINNNNNKDFQFWIQDNHPIQLSTGEMLMQRLNYLHENPVRAGFVTEPWHWKYSSAYDYTKGIQCLVELVWLA